MLSQNTVCQFLELFASPQGSVTQCGLSRKLWLQFKDTRVALNVRQFTALYRYLNGLDWEALLEEPNRDFTFLHLPEADFFMALGLTELVQLQALVEGAKTMLDLNSILYERLYSVFA
ncbi:hypothetical protein [Eisenibacter elegans]|jgi:hypothetical protein|uniref:hypothetical protein n=1 Tax=Eisenibacter elegans TaxID=997 RepID=UPI0004266BBB|nr:hypothetical protein [Eisenibacter elegans]